MARKDAKMGVWQGPPQRRLEYLLNETYMKIDALREVLRREAAIFGVNEADPGVARMFSRQDYLVTLCAEACIEQERRNAVAAAASVKSHCGAHGLIPESPFECSSQTLHPENSRDSKVEKEEEKHEGSWYGSLDRSISKKKKHQLMDKRRRHTKTIGSMAGLDVIKKSNELKPDEQYEIGLPTAPRVTSSRSSIFPMTQHQYYTALMESKMTKKPAYPLEVRQMPVQPVPPCPPPVMMQRLGANWGGYYLDNLVDENKNMKRELDVIPQTPLTKPHLVPVPRLSASKQWYETNLDDCAGKAPPTPTVRQNPSPSPSILSSTKGSSRGSIASGNDVVDASLSRMAISSPANESTEFTSKSSESSESWSGTANEVIKPFEMSDYYKYSTKFRNLNSPLSENASEPRSPNGLNLASSSPSIIHSRQSSQSFEVTGGTANESPSAVPKLPPKQRRYQNRSMSSSSAIFEGDLGNIDPSQEFWLTNQPTFV